MKEEKLYRMLKDKLGKALEIMTINELPSLKNLEKNYQQLIVFDDFISDKNQDKMVEYIIYCRKYNISLIFLAQSYFSVDKVIRQNVSYLVLLNMTDSRNTNLIIHTMGIPVEKEVIKSIISNATKEKLNCCIIDMACGDLNRTFRRNFNEFYELEDDGELINPVKMFKHSGLLN